MIEGFEARSHHSTAAPNERNASALALVGRNGWLCSKETSGFDVRFKTTTMSPFRKTVFLIIVFALR